MTDRRIYVASLAAYNVGTVYGRWIEVTTDLDDLNDAIEEMLSSSPVPGDEWAIHEFEGFGPYGVAEHESLSDLVTIARLQDEHGNAALAYVEMIGCPPNEAEERFTEAYQGSWTSLAEYAEEYLEEFLGKLPSLVRRYFDIESYSRDLELGGEVWTHTDEEGAVHVFWNC